MTKPKFVVVPPAQTDYRAIGPATPGDVARAREAIEGVRARRERLREAVRLLHRWIGYPGEGQALDIERTHAIIDEWADHLIEIDLDPPPKEAPS